jgi:hypothetical protein
MRHFLLFISILVLVSCDHYITTQTVQVSGGKIAVQQYYTSCNGICGPRIVFDNLQNERQSLLAMNDIMDLDCRLCNDHRIGTQKSIETYNDRFVYKYSLFRPVYDTNELKKQYPNIDRAAYFDSTIAKNSILPLTSLDSVLISRALEQKNDSTCKIDYLRFIRGFVFVDSTDVKIKKEKL